MPRHTKNLLGQTFGVLRVVSSADPVVSNRGNGRIRRDSAWKCVCKCDKELIVLADRLLNGNSKSCGSCWRQVPGMAFRNAVHNYKNGALNRGYDFSLTDEQCRTLFLLDCFYCGTPPSNVSKARWKSGKEEFIYSGIDRRDNTIGYVESNCVSCCYTCNRAKLKRSEKDFIDHCKAVAGRFS